MRDKSYEVGPSCKVAKTEELDHLGAMVNISGGQPYQRICGLYAKDAHAEADKEYAKMVKSLPQIEGLATPRTIGFIK
jgi:hypothetical protein